MPKLRVLFASLTLTLLISWLGLSSPGRALSETEEVKWSAVDIPAEGRTGNWVLAPGSDVQYLTMARDGTLYCYARPSGTNYTLFKSADGGYTWSYTGKVVENIVAIVAAPDDANVIYYATAASVYKSTDAGVTFFGLPLNPGGAGSNNTAITSLSVAKQNNSYFVSVGTKDSDSSQFGGVYIFDEKKSAGWLNTNIGNYDVIALTFSPNYASDYQLMAVVTNEVDTLVRIKVDIMGWGEGLGNATIGGLVARGAILAFPDDYNATNSEGILFAAIDTGGGVGDVYQVKLARAPLPSMATDLDIGYDYQTRNIDISGLAVSGNTANCTLLAGAASSTQIYTSTNGGKKWVQNTEKPTGQSKMEILLSSNFTSQHKVYVATSGAGSALSQSLDGGLTWSQIGLIDTQISNIVDAAPSPNYSQDTTLFLLTFDTEHSLWRSTNGGLNWERTITGSLAGADALSRLELSPQYGNNSRVVYLAGTSGGSPAIWVSLDNGQTFRRRGIPFTIDTWLVIDNSTILIGSYNGTAGFLYRVNNSGLNYSIETIIGSNPLASIALSPEYVRDKIILVGDTRGRVYLSKDDGVSFEQVGHELPKGLLPGDTSSVSVAFDTNYSRNKTIYAVSDMTSTNTSKERIFRFISDKSKVWESIDSTLPAGSILNDLKLSTGGILYAANFKAANGMERSLDPTYSLGPRFETVTRNLETNSKLFKIRLSGNQLWSVDTQNNKLMTYIDSLSRQINLVSPSDRAQGAGTNNVSLDWQTLPGATKYMWQLDYDTDFSTIPPGLEGETEESAAHLLPLDMSTTYYWRVRASQPVLSPWSDKWSFTTSLGSAVVAPTLRSPRAGASSVMLNPVFQWTAIAGADSYELVVSTDSSLSNHLITKTGDYALTATAWRSDIELDYDAAYYWKVRAKGSGSYSDWSAVGAFTTLQRPIETTAQPTPQPANSLQPLPAVPAQPAFPGWFMYLGFGLLLIIALLLVVIMLALVAVIRRL